MIAVSKNKPALTLRALEAPPAPRSPEGRNALAPPEPVDRPRREGEPLPASVGAPAPVGSIPAHQLRSGADNDRLRAGRLPSASKDPGKPVGGAAPIEEPQLRRGPDDELREVQERTMDVARGELERGVSNRSDPDRIAEYADDAGQPNGNWCGNFTRFAYAEAGREAGHDPSDRFFSLASFEKARGTFLYHPYTGREQDRIADHDALRAEHEADGSTRRFMAFEGSGGQRYAEEHGLGDRVEVYRDPAELPIRAGDTALFSRGHVGLVEAYDPATGLLTTIEGNPRVRRETYDLTDPEVRAQFEGFGRPARADLAP